MSQSTINIALASDENFAPHLASLVASILVNSRSDEQFSFYVLDGGIKPESKKKIQSLVSLKPFEIQFKAIDFGILENCPNIEPFSKNTYSRLLIPQMFTELSRILYLDCDMIVLDSLAELWNLDMQGKSLACVKENKSGADQSFQLKLILELDGISFFNAGMLLINLDKIRQEGSFRKVLEWTADHKPLVMWADQDGLNAIFRDDWIPVSDKWNYVSTMTNQSETRPTIIHYLTYRKPWHVQYEGQFQSEYLKYRDMTPWKGMALQEVTPPQTTLKYKKGFAGLKEHVADHVAYRLAKSSPWIKYLLWRNEQLQAREMQLKKAIERYHEVIQQAIELRSQNEAEASDEEKQSS